jgi:hypothetical protein
LPARIIVFTGFSTAIDPYKTFSFEAQSGKADRTGFPHDRASIPAFMELAVSEMNCGLKSRSEFMSQFS